MRLKEFITRSGGVITAIALLGSMVVMAGAVPDMYPYNCNLCGKDFYVHNIRGNLTYQQKYSVGTIPYLLNEEDESYSWSTDSTGARHGDLCVVSYNGSPICESCIESKVTEYKAANSGTISTPGTGSTPVTLTAAASTFKVTVPTSIPLVVGADSKVTSPSDVKIINNSAGPVKVTAIAMNDGAWTMIDYNGGDRSKLAAEKVGSNKLGLSLTAGGNTAASSTNGSQSPVIDSTKWRITGKNTGNNELPITVGAIASAVSTKIENAVTAANVVFTVAWDK